MAEQCFHSIQVFAIRPAALPASGVGGDESLGGDVAGPAKPIPHHATLSRKSQGKEEERGTFGVTVSVLPRHHHA